METILAENEKEVLLKIEKIIDFGGIKYKGVSYEWWVNKEKMKQGIYAEGKYIYCRGYTGCKEEDLVRRFNGK